MMAKNDLDSELGAEFFKTRTIKERVFEYLEEYPNINLAGLYFKFPEVNQGVIRVYKRDFEKLRLVDGYRASKLRKWINEMFFIMKWKMKPTERLSKEEKMALSKLEQFVKQDKSEFDYLGG